MRVGDGTHLGEVWTFGSGVNGQLGQAEATVSHRPRRVLGAPPATAVKAGGYLTAASDKDGGVWVWGSRGAGMFQPVPKKAELPKGARTGGLTDFACARDCVVFLSKGVGPDYFEKQTDLMVAKFREERLADERAFQERMRSLLEERRVRAEAKGEAFLRGAMARFRFARRAVQHYVSRKIVDPETGRRRRVYVNLKTGAHLKKRPYFLAAYGMEPIKEETAFASKVVQRVVRRHRANKEARKRALEVFELLFDDEDGKPYWFNPRTGTSSWDRPRWLQESDDKEIEAGASKKKNKTKKGKKK